MTFLVAPARLAQQNGERWSPGGSGLRVVGGFPGISSTIEPVWMRHRSQLAS